MPEIRIPRIGYLHPSAERGEQQLCRFKRVEAAGQRNPIIALNVQNQVHKLLRTPLFNKKTQEELQDMRSLAFEGLYPDYTDFNRVKTHLLRERSSVHIRAWNTMESLQQGIFEEEEKWRRTGYTGDLLRVLQETVAVDQTAKEWGGRVLMFGSARKEPGSPEFEGARWLMRMIAEHFVDEKGNAEQSISGAGPGIMEAANLGTLEGSWNALSKMTKEFREGGAKSEVLKQAILQHRSQMHSVGIRVQLPFEAGWNKHLHGNQTIKTFVPRKKGLIATAIGRADSHDKATPADWHGKHPAVFVFSGGFGTVDELWDVACLQQCKKMPRMPIIIVGEGMNEMVLKNLEVMEREKTITGRNEKPHDPEGDWKFFRFCRNEVDALHEYMKWHKLRASEGLHKALHVHRPVIGTRTPKVNQEQHFAQRNPSEDVLLFDRLIEEELAAKTS